MEEQVVACQSRFVERDLEFGKLFVEKFDALARPFCLEVGLVGIFLRLLDCICRLAEGAVRLVSNFVT